MSDQTAIQKRLSSLDIGIEQDGYAGVRIYKGADDNNNDIVYEAGDTSGNSGAVLEFRNEFATQTMADNVLLLVRGWQYQPYEGTAAHLDPAAELGDGITASGMYSGIYVKDTDYNTLTLSNISAPSTQEIEHELTVSTATDRQYTRFVKQTKAALAITESHISAEVVNRTAADTALSGRLDIQATQIAAKVSKTGGSPSSFGWTLTDSSWEVDANGTAVLRITSSGAEVKGSIRADSGYIGGSDGFVITANRLYKNIPYYGATQSSGVYIGTDGIQLGQGFKVNSYGSVSATSLSLTGGSINLNNRFIVDSSGNLTASSATVSGNITITSGSINLGNGTFSVGSNGSLRASSAEISGTIHVSGGDININNRFKVDSSGNVSITGGSININNAFVVDSQGNLSATSGTFSGYVHANKVAVGGDAGYIEGGQLYDRTIWGAKIAAGSVGSYESDSYMSTGAADGYWSVDALYGSYTTSPNMDETTTYLGSYPLFLSSYTFSGTTLHYVQWGY